MPEIIAECCQNHNGDREILRRMIRAAAENGADYVKIQAIRSRDLTFRERFENGLTDADGTIRVIRRPFAPEKTRLSQLDISLEDEERFVGECRRSGVAPMITIFTRLAAREIKNMGFEAVKIASNDCRSYPLLEDARRWWNKIYVSTGACYDEEIEKATQVLSGTRFTFLHCVTIYPTPMEDLHLKRMNWLRQLTPFVGFSDHTLVPRDHLWASKIALALGADCIERHFTVLNSDQTRDGLVSITPPMLKELRQFADLPLAERMKIVCSSYPEWGKTLGQIRRSLSHQELLNRDYYTGRLASKIGGQIIYNWEPVDIDGLLKPSAC